MLNDSYNNKNVGLSFLRVCSMFMIVLCHYCNYIGISWLAQFLNVGVYIFFLMSGWLYSKKRIDKPIRWIINRWIKLYVPVIIWVVLVIIYSLTIIRKSLPVGDLILLLTNMQGFSWVILDFPKINSNDILGGLGNLWFVSVIMLCYLLMIIVKRIEDHHIWKNKVLIAVISAVCFIVLALFRVQLAYFICYFIGYALGREKELISPKQYILLTVGMISAVSLRLIAKHFIDGTVAYDLIVVGISHTTIAIWIFYTVRLVAEKVKFFQYNTAKRITYKIDEFSYFIYITHNYFLYQHFGLRNLVPDIVLQTLIFCVLTLITAVIVKVFSELIVSRVFSKCVMK